MGWKSFINRFRERPGEKRLNRKRNTVESVGGRSSDMAGRRKNRLVVAVLVLIFAALTGTVLWMAVRKAGEELLYTNPEYRLRSIDVLSDGQRLTREKVKQWAEIETGMNMHDVNIAKIRKDLLLKAPVIKSVSLARLMPDRLEIRISERLPIACVGLLGLKGVDQQGYVFAITPSRSPLPIILCPEDPPMGKPVQGKTLNAVEVVDLLGRTALGGVMHVEMLDVRDPDCLQVRLSEVPRVPIKWTDMAMSTPESRLALDGKLRSLARVIEDARMKNQRLARVDMTFNDDYIPVEYAR